MRASSKEEVLPNTETPPTQAEKKRELWISPDLPRLMGRRPEGKGKRLPASTPEILAKERRAGVFSMGEYVNAVAKKRRAKSPL